MEYIILGQRFCSGNNFFQRANWFTLAISSQPNVIPGNAFCWYPKSIKFIILAWLNALHYNSLAFGWLLLDSAGRWSQKFIGSFVMNVSSLAFTCSIEDRSTYIIDMSEWGNELHEDGRAGEAIFKVFFHCRINTATNLFQPLSACILRTKHIQ